MECLFKCVARCEVLLVCNGQTVENFPLRRNRNSLDISYDLAVSNSGWCHLRTEGEPGDRFPFDVAYTQALTNPVWLQVGDEVVRNRQAAEYGIAWIDKLEQLADAWPGWRSEREKAHVFGQFEQARQVYRQNLP